MNDVPGGFRRQAGCPATNGAATLMSFRAATLAAIAIVLTVAPGCGSGVQERVIPVKQETPITQVKNLLRGYTNGEPVGSEIIGFPSLREAVVAEDPEAGRILAEGLTEIEKIFRSPRKVPKVAQAILDRLDRAATPAAGEP